MALWSKSTGKLILTLDQDLAAQTNYVIRLIVKNPTAPPSGGAQAITLSAALTSTLTGTPCSSCGLVASYEEAGVFNIVQPTASFTVTKVLDLS
jgi:hypothetical protein